MRRRSMSVWTVRIVAVLIAFILGPPIIGVLLFVVGSLITPH